MTGSSIEPPSFHEVLNAAKDNGLVGEQDTLLTVILAMIRGGLIVMTGPARAGKDEVVDAAESVFNTEQMVYRWPVDDSETAAYYKRETINRHPIHRFPDLARLEEHHEKILKAFGEGRDAERNRTDIMAEQAGGDAVEDQVLECPRTVIAFIASDNENVNMDDYPELRNRAFMLSVDASEQQTKRVNRRKAKEHAGKTERGVDAVRAAEIEKYHTSIPVEKWDSNPSNKLINPGAVEIHDREPIPEKFPEARQDFDRLLEFMDTVAIYYHEARLTTSTNTGEKMYVTPTDIWHAMTILGNRMVMSALNLRREDRAVLELLDKASANMTKAEVQQNLRAQGYNVTDRDVRRSLDSMRTKGYVRVHQGTPNEYSFNEFGSVVHHDQGMDYGAIVDSCAEEIYDVAPDDLADEYVERFCQGDGLITTHPFTGEAINIVEHDELEEMVSEGVDAVEEVFEGESADEEADEQQGTII